MVDQNNFNPPIFLDSATTSFEPSSVAEDQSEDDLSLNTSLSHDSDTFAEDEKPRKKRRTMTEFENSALELIKKQIDVTENANRNFFEIMKNLVENLKK